MKKTLLLMFSFFMLLSTSFAIEKINVKIPTFATSINDTIFNNENEKYPLIVYKDITYFPMTWNMCKSIGLVSGWDDEKGLYISSYLIDGEYESYKGNNVKNKNYSATIVNYPITINGKKIDNAKEEYPLINFRDITYFPLTWRFASDEFGWKINWDNIKGLDVNTTKTNNNMFTAQITDEYALLYQDVSSYDKQTDENGDEVYTLNGIKYANYKLNFNNDELSLIGYTDNISDNEKQNINENILIKDGKMYYKNKVVEGITLSADAFDSVSSEIEIDECKFIGVCIYENKDIPAPYTPHKYYLFYEKNNEIRLINEWDSSYEFEGAYKFSEGYYLYSNHKNLGGRFNNNSGIILVMKNDGSVEKLNDKYKDYNSLNMIGVYDNDLYVMAKCFSNIDAYGYGDVNAVNDGILKISANGDLEKIYDFVFGEIFMNSKGKIYCIMNMTNEIVNITDRKIVKK